MTNFSIEVHICFIKIVTLLVYVVVSPAVLLVPLSLIFEKGHSILHTVSFDCRGIPLLPVYALHHPNLICLVDLLYFYFTDF